MFAAIPFYSLSHRETTPWMEEVERSRMQEPRATQEAKAEG
jgi:hypothetical protein